MILAISSESKQKYFSEKQKGGVIYKITNPTGKIYIGCTIDWKRRFSEYRRLSMVGQRKLYNSLKKYGYENHVFEIIEECNETMLHEREIYYINYYNCITEGLNIRLGNRNGRLTEETKQKISESLKGRPVTWKTHGSKGYKYTDEQKQKMRKPRVNKWEREKLVPEVTVKEIREKFSTGNYSKSDLSREYNLSWGTIKNIVDSINSYKQ
jgi:group I intron endonuclease